MSFARLGYSVRMALSGKDKSTLRSVGQKGPDDVRLGKEGLSEGFLTNLKTLLARKELVKLRFTELEGEERKAMAAEVAAASDAELVSVVGRTVLLYRANPKLDAAKRVLKA